MRTKINYIALFALLFVNQIFAQDVTTVTANSYDISDNLDLTAVASIFGDSRDLEDFERKLNDPNIQISNLDLNNDNRVDYLRVIEVTENNTHLIILQSVLGIDTFQDVATIEVERDRQNNVHVQVVGDVYMYGPNYIYEPVYVNRPLIYDVFWVSSYRPYYSPWYWGYYPTYYSYWNPYPVYRYRNNLHIHINNRNRYNYVYNRRSSRAIALHNSRRANAYERQYPDRAFARRTSLNNRYVLEQSRGSYSVGTRTSSSRNTYNSSSRSTNTNATRTNSVRNSNINRNSVNSSRRSSDNQNSSTTRNSSSRRNSNNTSTSRSLNRNQNARSSSSRNRTDTSGSRTTTRRSTTPTTTRSSNNGTSRSSSSTRSGSSRSNRNSSSRSRG
ncbi:hypothetical protein [Flavobacterium litorale]|uniref:DUF3300 domain-containing protein n=1 Tax=Flavobacterium litorale TaxID=2856519 RepID=A0ABX8VAM7_9FLAO|nr:hypothetical protein [Flavobacterium litorale]QYJ67704.1 hypothetical protein K1I41_09125 [Flavobacterium litorale]